MAKLARRRRSYRPSMAPVSSRRVTDYRLPVTEPVDLDPNRIWYLIYTNPKCERRAMLGLKRAGYDCFLPTMKRVSESRYQIKTSVVPMFPRYVFVSGRQRTMIRTIDGVQDVVRCGLDWAPVPAAAIAAIVGFQNEPEPEPEPPFKIGEQVRVADGPFASFNAIVEKMLGHDRAQVLVHIFGRSTRIELHLAQMEAA